MKTRIIRTNIHDFEPFLELAPASKYVFLHLASSNEIGHTNIFYYPDSKITYYTGLTKKQIDQAKSDLGVIGIAFFFEGYVCLSKLYAVTTGGPKNEIAESREYEMLPDKVKQYFSDTVLVQYQYSTDTTINHKLETINNKTENKNEINEEFLDELQSKFPAVRVRYEWDKARDYIASSGKKYKDYQAFFRNWVRRVKENPGTQKSVKPVSTYKPEYDRNVRSAPEKLQEARRILEEKLIIPK